MNQALKQRLVGTLVLGCLAIIFIPLLLDGEGISPAGIQTQAPAAPALSYDPVPLPERPVIEADAFGDDADAAALTPSEVLDEAAPADSAPAPASAAIPLPVPADRVDSPAAADVTPQRDVSGLPEAWTVRLGVFGNPGNADKLRACLIASGYQAYSRQQQGDNGSLTRVFVGPVATRAEANALVNRLKGQCELTENGMAVRYTQP